MRALARFLALAAALLAVLPAGALPAQYYCRWMGQTMTSCCCRGHEAKAQKASEDQLERANCCELVPSSDVTMPATREMSVHIDAVAIVERSAVPGEVVGDERVVAALPPQARGPPALGPPLYLSYCSLLI